MNNTKLSRWFEIFKVHFEEEISFEIYKESVIVGTKSSLTTTFVFTNYINIHDKTFSTTLNIDDKLLIDVKNFQKWYFKGE